MTHSQNSPDEWTAAHCRLDGYLQAHGFRDRAWQTQVVLHVLAEAQMRYRDDPSTSPMSHTFDVMEQWMSRWFMSQQEFRMLPEDRLLCTGKVYLYLIDAMERWPAAFMSTEAPPEDMIQEISKVCFVPNPDLEVAVMIPREPMILDRTDLKEDSEGWWLKYVFILFALVLASVVTLFLRR